MTVVASMLRAKRAFPLIHNLRQQAAKMKAKMGATANGSPLGSEDCTRLHNGCQPTCVCVCNADDSATVSRFRRGGINSLLNQPGARKPALGGWCVCPESMGRMEGGVEQTRADPTKGDVRQPVQVRSR